MFPDLTKRGTNAHDEERTRLADEIAGLRAEIKALRNERNRTQEVTNLNEQIEDLKMEKARLVEENDRKIRETEHKVGLVKLQQDHEVANATREAIIKVQEEALNADKERFTKDMEFQREHFEKVASDNKEMMKEILKRLPDVNATLALGGKRDKS